MCQEEEKEWTVLSVTTIREELQLSAISEQWVT